MTVTAARHAVNAAALARDRVALVALGASLPATTAYSYERHRARALRARPRGLERRGAWSAGRRRRLDASLRGRAGSRRGRPPSSARRLPRSSIALAASEAFRSTASAGPSCSLRRAQRRRSGAAPAAAALVRHPRVALVALGAAFNAMGDRRSYRLALAATGLLTALVCTARAADLLVDGSTSVAGVTAPSFAAPPSVVVVPSRPRPPQRSESPRLGPVPPASVGTSATLVSVSSTQSSAPGRLAARARSGPVALPHRRRRPHPPSLRRRPLPLRLRSRIHRPLRSPSRRPWRSRPPRRRRRPAPAAPAPPAEGQQGQGEGERPREAGRQGRCSCRRRRRSSARGACGARTRGAAAGEHRAARPGEGRQARQTRQGQEGKEQVGRCTSDSELCSRSA